MLFNKLAFVTIGAYATQSVVADSIYEIAANNPDFSTLTAAIDAADLVETLSSEGTYTIFAPPNSAFAKVPEDDLNRLLKPTWKPQLQDLLFYHGLGSVVRSTDLTDGLTTAALNDEYITINLDPPRINENSIILIDDGLVDIEADNGVIHGIDTVLAPTSALYNIVDIGKANMDAFSTLMTLVDHADLVGALSGEGPYTIFAPTNAAFSMLPEGSIEYLLSDDNIDELTDILKYHVVEANALSSDLSSGELETLSGDTLDVDVFGDDIFVNGLRVIDPDIIVSNGIIHVIEMVLLPPIDQQPSKKPTGDNRKSKSSKSKSDKSSKSSKNSKKGKRE